MERYTGVLGILLILFIGYIFSNNKKAINYRLIFMGLFLQVLTGIFILRTRIGGALFKFLAFGVTQILELSQKGAKFVFGSIADDNLTAKVFGEQNSFIFAFQIAPTIIFVCALVSVFYYFGILQKVIKIFALFFNKILGVSGAEALANSIVAVVGQVESAIIIQPYLSKMTKSEILTIMTGGMACISGSLMAVYSNLGIQTEYLIGASFMAVPGSFVISKLFYPEDENPATRDTVKINFQVKEKSLIEAILNGAYSGARISIGVIAMLIAFISLIAMIDKMFFYLNNHLSIRAILGFIFTPFVYFLGVPKEDVINVAQLLGTKISLNEFIAYLDLSNLIQTTSINNKSTAIATFLLCGFANFGSIAIQVGGLSQMARERKDDFSALGFKAMICGALVSCVSGCIAGILL